MQCSVTSFSFAPNNVGHPGSNEAAYRCENTPNKHGWKCQTIHYLLPMESRMLQRGQTVLFFSGIQQQQAVSWLMCCDWHSPCTAGGGDSHGWRPSVLLFKLSWDIGLLSRLRLHLTAHFHYPSTLFWFHMCPETSCASHRFNKRPDCEHWSEGMFCSTRLLKWDKSIQKKTHCCCSAMVDEWTPHRWKPQNMSFGVVL